MKNIFDIYYSGNTPYTKGTAFIVIYYISITVETPDTKVTSFMI